MGFIRDGRLKAIAVGSPTRLPLLPEVPTLAEGGVKGDLLLPTYSALAAPANTPREIVVRLHDELAKALAPPEVAGRLAANGLVAATSTPQVLWDLVRQDIGRFAAQTKVLGIKPE